jgi:uncharacterized membrane protein YsdA (DUF1294 family)
MSNWRRQEGGRTARSQPVQKTGRRPRPPCAQAAPVASLPAHRALQPRWGGASYLAIPLFGLLFLISAVAWRLPFWTAALYAVVSIVTFLAYAIDKAAAKAGRRRTPESTLLFLGLAGGWPGAIVAQQRLRHKSVKQAFRSAFWGTVVVNVALFLLLASPHGRGLLLG